MDHYIDLHVRAPADMGRHHLMAVLFYKLHAWIAHHACGRIGLSFPAMQKTPGTHLRVHGSLADLSRLSSGDWRNTLLLWLQQGPVTPVPGHAQHCVVARVQKKSAHNMRQRAMRRDGLTHEQSLARIPDSATEVVSLPYLDIRSSSSGQTLRFFIRQGPPKSTAVPGPFSAYGMSHAGATVPWF